MYIYCNELFLKEIIIYTFFLGLIPLGGTQEANKKKSPTSPIKISAFHIVYAAHSVFCFGPEKL